MSQLARKVERSETITLRRDLSPGDGIADDTAGFTDLVARVNASTAHSVVVRIGPGSYRVASAALAAQPMTWMRDNVHVQGSGKPRMTVTGATVTPYVFGALGRSDITYQGIRFVGNNAANAYANGVAISFCNDSVADIEGHSVTQCHFENFKGDYWIYHECLGTKAMQDIRVTSSKFESRTGNARGPANVAINSGFVAVIGNAANASSYIDDVWVSGNAMRATYIKSGVMVYNNVYNWHIDRNQIRDAGKLEVSDDSGAYAIQVYSQGPNVGSDGEVHANRIRAPRSCGIYHANTFPRTTYTANVIWGQTDTVSGTLPKGGMVFNGAREVSAIGNTVTDCAAAGIFWSQPGNAASDGLVKFDDNTIARCAGAGGIVFESSQQASGNVSASGNTLSGNATGILLNLINSGTLVGVLLSRNRIASTVANSYGVRVFSGDGSYRLDEFVLEGGSINTDAYGLLAPNITFGSITAKGVSFVGNFSDSAINVSGSTKVCLIGDEFDDFTAGGFCLKSSGARGSVRGLVFRNVSAALLVESTGGEDLGLDAPTWAATQGMFVQNLLPVDATIGAANSVIDGWRYTTAWRAQHMLRA